MQIIPRNAIRVFLPIAALIALQGCQSQNDFDLAASQAKAGNAKQTHIAMVKIADGGDLQAMAWLMQDATIRGLDKPDARKQFVLWAERCAEKGNVTCAESAGIFYWSGIDGAIDFKMAEKWFIKAKASGSPSAEGWLEDVRHRKPASPSIRKLEA